MQHRDKIRWFLILFEFDFAVVVKQGKTHLRADHLSRLTNREKPEGINDELPNTYLLSIETVPKWSNQIVSLMSIGNFKQVPIRLVEKSKPYLLLVGWLYKQMDNKVLNLCIEPEEQPHYLHQSHIAIGGVHFFRDQTLQRLKHLGVFWPTFSSKIV